MSTMGADEMLLRPAAYQTYLDLMAERDLLISQGVDPDRLLMPTLEG